MANTTSASSAAADTSIPKEAVAVDISSTNFDCTAAFVSSPFARRITVLGAGNLSVVFAGHSRTVTYTGVPAGFQLVGAIVTVVKATTTATNMIAEA